MKDLTYEYVDTLKPGDNVLADMSMSISQQPLLYKTPINVNKKVISEY